MASSEWNRVDVRIDFLLIDQQGNAVVDPLSHDTAPDSGPELRIGRPCDIASISQERKHRGVGGEHAQAIPPRRTAVGLPLSIEHDCQVVASLGEVDVKGDTQVSQQGTFENELERIA